MARSVLCAAGALRCAVPGSGAVAGAVDTKAGEVHKWGFTQAERA